MRISGDATADGLAISEVAQCGRVQSRDDPGLALCVTQPVQPFNELFGADQRIHQAQLYPSGYRQSSMTAEPATVRLHGQDHPVPVAVPERLVTRQDERGPGRFSTLALGVGSAD